MGSVSQFGKSRRWLAAVCALFVVLLLTAQAMHVHPDHGLSPTACPICLSAHTSTPVTGVFALIVLVAIASVAILAELQAPKSEAILPLFIRPPPLA